MMNFNSPEFFWLFLLLPFLILILYRSYKKRRLELQKIGGLWRSSQLDSVYLLRSFFSGFFLSLTFIFLILAMSGLRWGHVPIEDSHEGLDIALAIDISHSMLAQDVKPNRLTAACEEARQLIQAFPLARFSLVTFKGSAVTLVPLTPDTEILEKYLSDLSPAILYTGTGTNIEIALQEASRSLDHPTAHYKVIILFSDGETHEGDILTQTRRLGALGVKVFTVGIGTVAGTTIPQKEGVMVDSSGFTIQTRLDEKILKVVASGTEGRFYPLLGTNTLRDLQDQLAILSNSALQRGIRLESVQHDQFFLCLALGTLLGFLFVRRFPWKNIF